ncbi:MAG: sigma-54-dependent Fis family transcriptional regulator [Acidobacteria bacterium]|nr:sigma-54-dependent Fis family transcriptional regulator [Acidobacteriota bacterium]
MLIPAKRSDEDYQGMVNKTMRTQARAVASAEMQALVIDDESQIRQLVADILRTDGWQVSEADTAERAFELLEEQPCSLVFCDVHLGGMDGYAVLRRLTQEHPGAHIVLMTGYGSAAGALDATASGAYDYLLKPFALNEVLKLSVSVRERLKKRQSPLAEREGPIGSTYTSELNLIGRSAAFLKVMKTVGRLAATNLPVLITGESGTGKEVVARAIHLRSKRASKAFVAVNCGAVSENLLESELFGHMRGSFTGADRDRIGLWEEADRGTVLLDEITETTQAFQVKLLRALQEGEVRRVGSNRMIHVDVRVIAAANRDPEMEVQRGRFRQDLLYRLNAVSLHLPPLRERREDIMPLARHFARRVRSTGNSTLHFSRDAIQLLEAYLWPGNIRELENAVERAAALGDHTIRPEDLPERIRDFCVAPIEEPAPQTEMDSPACDNEWPTLATIQGRFVARVLAHTNGNKQAAARLLDVDRKTLQRMIKRYNLGT